MLQPSVILESPPLSDLMYSFGFGASLWKNDGSPTGLTYASYSGITLTILILNWLKLPTARLIGLRNGRNALKIAHLRMILFSFLFPEHQSIRRQRYANKLKSVSSNSEIILLTIC